MQWYYAKNGKQTGPVDEAEFRNLAAQGNIKGDTLVWNETLSNWVKYGTLAAPTPPPEPVAPAHPAKAASVASVLSAQGASVEAKCAECGKTFPLEDTIEYRGTRICAACKPAFFQKLQEGATLPGTMTYAGFWIRFVAKFIDGIIMGAINGAVGAAIGIAIRTSAPEAAMAAQFSTSGIQILLNLVYVVFFLGKFGATPGKMACRLKVVRSDGTPITSGRAAGRYFADWLSGMILCIGYIMAAFDDEKRALHDRICDTRVVYR